jgi:uncharacterized RDD family membrane protein YckC
MNTPNPYAPPRAAVSDIVDPNAPPARADRITRLAAAILDGIIAVAMIYLPLLIGGGSDIIVAGLTGRATSVTSISPLWGLLALVGLVAWIWLTILYVARNGQTIAKKLLGIKVVRTDGSKASLGRIFWLRNVVNAILSIIPFYQLVDVLLIFGEARQCVHDKLADTIVVKA